MTLPSISRRPMRMSLSACAWLVAGLAALQTSAALAQACTPVVYMFRHAEDTNPPNPPGPIFTLTPTGKAHAALYPALIGDFQAAHNYCAVAKVYATTKADKPSPCGTQCTSATNAFDTAAPLAQAVMATAPITVVGGMQLYEYLGNGNSAPANPDYGTPVARALRADLVATANGGKSSAIFWTSQGMHVLGGAIIGATSNVPVKNGSALPPRNAVYLFKAVGGATVTGFSDTPLATGGPVPSSRYVQCFNHVESSTQFNPPNPQFIAPTGSPPTQRYYCGYDASQSNLGGKPPDSCKLGDQCGTIANADNANIKGKICDTTSLLPNTAGPSMFGACN